LSPRWVAPDEVVDVNDLLAVKSAGIIDEHWLSLCQDCASSPYSTTPPELSGWPWWAMWLRSRLP